MSSPYSKDDISIGIPSSLARSSISSQHRRSHTSINSTLGSFDSIMMHSTDINNVVDTTCNNKIVAQPILTSIPIHPQGVAFISQENIFDLPHVKTAICTTSKHVVSCPYCITCDITHVVNNNKLHTLNNTPNAATMPPVDLNKLIINDNGSCMYYNIPCHIIFFGDSLLNNPNNILSRSPQSLDSLTVYNIQSFVLLCKSDSLKGVMLNNNQNKDKKLSSSSPTSSTSNLYTALPSSHFDYTSLCDFFRKYYRLISNISIYNDYKHYIDGCHISTPYLSFDIDIPNIPVISSFYPLFDYKSSLKLNSNINNGNIEGVTLPNATTILSNITPEGGAAALSSTLSLTGSVSNITIAASTPLTYFQIYGPYIEDSDRTVSDSTSSMGPHILKGKKKTTRRKYRLTRLQRYNRRINLHRLRHGTTKRLVTKRCHSNSIVTTMNLLSRVMNCCKRLKYNKLHRLTRLSSQHNIAASLYRNVVRRNKGSFVADFDLDDISSPSPFSYEDNYRYLYYCDGEYILSDPRYETVDLSVSNHGCNDSYKKQSYNNNNTNKDQSYHYNDYGYIHNDHHYIHTNNSYKYRDELSSNFESYFPAASNPLRGVTGVRAPDLPSDDTNKRDQSRIITDWDTKSNSSSTFIPIYA